MAFNKTDEQRISRVVKIVEQNAPPNDIIGNRSNAWQNGFWARITNQDPNEKRKYSWQLLNAGLHDGDIFLNLEPTEQDGYMSFAYDSDHFGIELYGSEEVVIGDVVRMQGAITGKHMLFRYDPSPKLCNASEKIEKGESKVAYVDGNNTKTLNLYNPWNEDVEKDTLCLAVYQEEKKRFVIASMDCL